MTSRFTAGSRGISGTIPRQMLLRASLVIGAILSLNGTQLHAQKSFERAPILYSASQPTDRIAELQTALDSGRVSLKHDDAHGYLKSLLKELEIPISSQVLVFSKTSLQRHRISRRTPRAIYFNDDIYVGWVPDGDLIEISSTDRKLGAVFYSLNQEAQAQPKMTRQINRCMLCHASTHTRGVPGHILRSVFVDNTSRPRTGTAALRTDHTTPLEKRWGGWYVTGTHGRQIHMGNTVFTDINIKDRPDSNANITSLEGLIDTSPYLSPHSDIVALMVLAHQAAMHNEITLAGFRVLRAVYEHKQSTAQNGAKTVAALDQQVTESASRLVDWLLMVGEAPLTDPIVGTSSFTKDFQAKGPFDTSSRSLRHLDMKRRLFRYPCSFLIYSGAFDALPVPLLDQTYRQLWQVLTGKADSKRFGHLSAQDRAAILDILRQTKKPLPDYWRAD